MAVVGYGLAVGLYITVVGSSDGDVVVVGLFVITYDGAFVDIRDGYIYVDER